MSDTNGAHAPISNAPAEEADGQPNLALATRMMITQVIHNICSNGQGKDARERLKKMKGTLPIWSHREHHEDRHLFPVATAAKQLFPNNPELQHRFLQTDLEPYAKQIDREAIKNAPSHLLTA